MSAPLDFLRQFAGRLRSGGIRFAITSGMACVHYGLQQTTKDSDWIIAPEDLDKFRNLLNGARGGETGMASFLSAHLGAPLEADYLGHGWTSHLLLTEPDGAEQKVDLFGKPPRVQDMETEPGDADYASRHVVALTAYPRILLAGASRHEMLRQAQVDAIEAVAATVEELAQTTPPLDVLYP